MSEEVWDIIAVTAIDKSPVILLDIDGKLLKTSANVENGVVSFPVDDNKGNFIDALKALSFRNLNKVALQTIGKYQIYKPDGSGTGSDFIAFRCFISSVKFDFEGQPPAAFTSNFKAVDVTGGDLSDTFIPYTFFSKDEFEDVLEIDPTVYDWNETNPKVTGFEIVKSDVDEKDKFRYITVKQVTEGSSGAEPEPPPSGPVTPLSSAISNPADTSTPSARGAALDPPSRTPLSAVTRHQPQPAASYPIPPAPPAPPAPLAPAAPPALLAPLASARVEEATAKPAKAADDRLMDERQVAGLGAAAFAIAALGFLSAL